MQTILTHRDTELTVDWVDDAFRDSLAAIQERATRELGQENQLINFLKARVAGVQRKVPSAEARRAVIASGLPLSVGILAFNQLEVFREMTDRYLASEVDAGALSKFVMEFETWARQHAKTIVGEMPKQELLDKIRPLWLSGGALREIVETCGKDATGICTSLYGYQLPWLFHSVAQKLDKAAEENRVEALSKVALLVELGLPTETAAKVYLAGVRSRVAAVELGHRVTNPAASVLKIRTAFMDSAIVTALSALVSASTLEWLHLLSAEHGTELAPPPPCARFRLEAPDDVENLHVRQISPGSSIVLCSTDARFQIKVRATEQLPFDKFINDPRYIFTRDDGIWIQQCRDPRVDSLRRA